MIDPARSFDRAADEYEAARPDYPIALLDALPVPPDATVLDIGAGTGKLTRVLARRYAHVIAVEPLDNMRAILERVVPDAESHPGSADAIPLPDASVDAVFAAQAFHWFATDAVVAEIARVLKPGGVFADVFNESDHSPEFPDAYKARLDALFAQPRTGAEDDQRVAVIERGPFTQMRVDTVDHAQVQDRDSVLRFMQSISYVAKLPDDERTALMHELGSLLPEGTYSFPIVATARWAVRV
ncbi:MAG TPA: class I SAM-dependent methyltransferase [Gaiellaceae bacterium]|nr:class I SAM-dependent methyltransferase [Gaiellaceae bacterium]